MQTALAKALASGQVVLHALAGQWRDDMQALAARGLAKAHQPQILEALAHFLGG